MADTKYGIVHNNYFVIYHKRNSRGEKMKKQETKRIWVPWAMCGGASCVPFDTREEAQTCADGLFIDKNSFRIVELDENGYPVMTEELEKLGYGAEHPEF